jgi:hypothetical protein
MPAKNGKAAGRQKSAISESEATTLLLLLCWIPVSDSEVMTMHSGYVRMWLMTQLPGLASFVRCRAAAAVAAVQWQLCLCLSLRHLVATAGRFDPLSWTAWACSRRVAVACCCYYCQKLAPAAPAAVLVQRNRHRATTTTTMHCRWTAFASWYTRSETFWVSTQAHPFVKHPRRAALSVCCYRRALASRSTDDVRGTPKSLSKTWVT